MAQWLAVGKSELETANERVDQALLRAMTADRISRPSSVGSLPDSAVW